MVEGSGEGFKNRFFGFWLPGPFIIFGEGEGFVG